VEGKKLLHSIRLKNLLSYGSEGVELDLEPLNVLIGPNASGKSNLLDAISLLAAAPRNFLTPFRTGGTAEDWLWKGRNGKAAAEVEVRMAFYGRPGPGNRLRYRLAFDALDYRVVIQEEALESQLGELFVRDSLKAMVPEGIFDSGSDKPRTPIEVGSQESFLSRFRDPKNHPQLSYVSDQFVRIRFFRGWSFGRGNVLRRPQEVNLPDDFVLEDGSNLGLVLNDFENRREFKRLFLDKLRWVYDGIEDVTTKVQGGSIQIFFHEAALERPVPASHLSDGTLHFLCLLTVLLHPEPPPLICLEEPELGLHPDIIPKVADLLIDAAQRTQLIVTTHSETLVSRLSEVPESVVVCERDDRGTHLRRLEPQKLRDWLDRYTLGDLWAKGEIGGNRW
jgi:predicted ATPase